MTMLKRFFALSLTSAVAFLCAFSQIIRPTILIVSYPVTVAKVGGVYEYQVVAYPIRLSGNSSSDFFKYSLAHAPDGMTIDSAGLVRWVPTVTGTFAVEIVVSNPSGEKATQAYKLRVVDFLGTVSGIVRNESGEPIPRIIVTLYPLHSRTTASNTMPSHPIPLPIYAAVTDSLGQYTIANVDSGSYYAYAMPLCYLMMSPMPCWEDEYLPVWYQDAQTIKDATLIPVQNANTVQVNFVMHKREKPVPVTVSGQVTDTLGVPIAGATVIVSGARKSPLVTGEGMPSTGNEGMVRMPDAAGIVFPDVVSHARTDSRGNYHVSVLSGGTYIAACYARGYHLQYYKEKDNALEADRMTLTNDSADVNFRLVTIPQAVAKVSGVVSDSAGMGVPSKVILHRRLPVRVSNVADNLHGVVRSVHTDSLGNFSFEGVPDGSYLLLAVPFKDYLPAYYSASTCGELHWKNADSISVNGSDVSGLVVCVKKARARGAGNIAGRVSANTGIGVGGVVVVAELQADASVATYAVTDAEGNYELAGLDIGTYRVFADKMGYSESSTMTRGVDYEQSSSPANFQLSEESVTGIDESDPSIPENFSLSQNYPNPFNPTTVVSFQLPVDSYVRLKVYNMLGQEVASLVHDQLSSGVYHATWDAKSFPSGVYYYMLQAGKFVETRKMVLMK